MEHAGDFRERIRHRRLRRNFVRWRHRHAVAQCLNWRSQLQEVRCFFLKTDFAAGTYEAEIDFLVAGLVNYRIIIDVDELSATSYQADVYTRETDTDGWWLIGGIGAEAADTNGIFDVERYRYLKVIVTVTGGEFPSGVFGYAI
jgi:hypothetical protein